jgi:hypothetical protein
MKAIMSPEYIESIHVLNENTLNEACDLLLDDTDESSSKLLELYHKCESAYKVIRKQQPQAIMKLPPGAPNLNAPPPASRVAPSARPLPKLHKKNSLLGSIAGNKPGVSSLTMPAAMRRGVMNVNGKPPPSLAKPSSGRLVRDRSEADSVDSASNKKPRSSSFTSSNSSFQQQQQETSTPPPFALNFLAKLNKGGGDNPSSNNTKPEQQAPPEPPAPPKRKNPARSNNNNTKPELAPPEPPAPPKRKNPARSQHRRSSA